MIVSLNLTETEKMQLEYLKTVNQRESRSSIVGKLISKEYKSVVNTTLQGNFGGGTLKRGHPRKE